MRLLFVCIAVWMGASATAALGSQNRPGTCRIEVTSFRKSGKSSRRIFKIPLDGKADCAAAAKLHEENFNPSQITRVEVRSQFLRSTKEPKP